MEASAVSSATYSGSGGAPLIPTTLVQGFCDDLKASATSALDDARLLGTVDSTVLSVFLEELAEKIDGLETRLRSTRDDTSTLISAELAAARHVADDRIDENTFLRGALSAEEVRIREMLWRLGSRDRVISELKAHVIRQSTHGLSGMTASFAALPFQLVESLDAEVHHIQTQASQRVSASQSANHVALQKQRAAYEDRLNAKERELIQAQMRYRDSLRSLEASHAVELWRAHEEKRELQGLLTDVDQHATQRAEAFCAERYDEKYADARREFVATMEKLKQEVDRLHEERDTQTKAMSALTKSQVIASQQAAFAQAALRHLLEVEVPAMKAQWQASNGGGDGASGTVTASGGHTLAAREEHAALVNRALSLETELSTLTEAHRTAKQTWESESLSLQQQLKISRHEAATKDTAMREAQATKTQLNTQLQNALKTELQLQAEVDFLRRSAGAASAESFRKMLEQAEADHDIRMVELTDEVNALREKLDTTLDDKVELTERLRVSEASFRACDAERSEFRTRSNKVELRMSEMKQQYDSVQERLIEVQRTLVQERAASERLQQQLQAQAGGGGAPRLGGGAAGGLQRSKSMRQSVVNVVPSGPGDGAQPGAAGSSPNAALKRIGSTMKRVGSMVGTMGRTKSLATTAIATATTPDGQKGSSEASTSGSNLLSAQASGVTFTVGGPRKSRSNVSSSSALPLPFDDIEVVPGSPDKPTSTTAMSGGATYDQQNNMESSVILTDPSAQWGSLGAGGLALPQLAIQRVSVQLDEGHGGVLGNSYLTPSNGDHHHTEGGADANALRQLTSSQNLAVANFVFPMSPHAAAGGFVFAGSLRGDASLVTSTNGFGPNTISRRTSADSLRVPVSGGAAAATDVPVAVSRFTSGAMAEYNSSSTGKMGTSFSSTPNLDALPPLTLLRVASIQSHEGRQQLVLMPHNAGTYTSVGTQCDDAPSTAAPRHLYMQHGATVPISVDDRRTHAQLRHELTVLHREVCYLEHQLSSLHDQHPVLQRSQSRPSHTSGVDDDVPLWKRAGLICQQRPYELQPIPFTDITHRKEFLEENMKMAEELDLRHKLFVKLREVLAQDLEILHNLGATVVRPAAVEVARSDPKIEPHSSRSTDASPHRPPTSPASQAVVVLPIRNSMPPAHDVLVARHSTSPPTTPRNTTPGENHRTSPVRVKVHVNTAALQQVVHPVTPRSCGGAPPQSVLGGAQQVYPPKRPSSSARPTSAATSRRTWTSSSGDGLSGGNTTPSSLMQDLRTSIATVLEPADYFSVGYRTEESRRPHSARTSSGGQLAKAPVWSSATMGAAPVGGSGVGNSFNVPTVRVVSAAAPALPHQRKAATQLARPQ